MILSGLCTLSQTDSKIFQGSDLQSGPGGPPEILGRLDKGLRWRGRNVAAGGSPKSMKVVYEKKTLGMSVLGEPKPIYKSIGDHLK